ncbi:bacteriocin maturation protein [Bacillus sp. 1P06AnD]|uniref:bacteriocin maturation protein n=1 Tax=Bacillus sp. 1P06AnD TaxID=3132208 RepID=UPI0039A17264
MTALIPTMRLKLNKDTFFLPEPNKGVYIRNNLTSLRLEGQTIDQWLEKLTPAFNGLHSLQTITAGLTVPYQNRVYEIAQILLDNGFLRDVSADKAHDLSEQLLDQYAPQIEFLDSMGGSGGFRFQVWREAKVAIIGEGPLLLSLIQSLFHSGMPHVAVFCSNEQRTDQHRIEQLVNEAKKTEAEAAITAIEFPEYNERAWTSALAPYDSVMYGGKGNQDAPLKLIQSICKKNKKWFLPIVTLKGDTLIGPIIAPSSHSKWESAFKRLHDSDRPNSPAYPASTSAISANIAGFELFKAITDIKEPDKENQFFLLSGQTLEGKWHTFVPPPSITGDLFAVPINQGLLFAGKEACPTPLHEVFDSLTSRTAGIFHLWEEAELNQLPLSQCKVQTIDPLSKGPANLLPTIIHAALTHEEARKEAGLSGIEHYMKGYSSLFHLNTDILGIGTGETAEEGIYRALQNWLDLAFRQHQQHNSISASLLNDTELNDSTSSYLYEALITMEAEPNIFIGPSFLGFPVAWVRSRHTYYGCPGFTGTLAVKRALQLAVMAAQNKESVNASYGVVSSNLTIEKNKVNLQPDDGNLTHSELLASISKNFQLQKKTIHTYELHAEPLFEKVLPGIYGIYIEGVERE